MNQEGTSLDHLSKEELIHYQELFSVFDKDDSGTIPTAQFPTFVCGLGHCPTEAELREMKSTLDPHNQGKIPFATLITLLLKRPQEKNIEEQIMEAFEGLQSEAGSLSDGEKTYKMSIKEARKFLMDFGETLSDSEAEKFQEFLEENNLKDGLEFNFHDFAKIMAYSYQN
jgi:Ca2+-binding EF-hand superfamily protein